MVSGPTSPAVATSFTTEEDDQIVVLLISIPESERRWPTLSMKDHSSNTVSYHKSLRIQAFKCVTR